VSDLDSVQKVWIRVRQEGSGSGLLWTRQWSLMFHKWRRTSCSSRRGLQLMWSHPFWVEPPDIHPTEVLFAKGKLPDVSLFQLAASSLSLNTSRPSVKTRLISLSTSRYSLSGTVLKLQLCVSYAGIVSQRLLVRFLVGRTKWPISNFSRNVMHSRIRQFN
jgi:hypothetical protein